MCGILSAYVYMYCSNGSIHRYILPYIMVVRRRIQDYLKGGGGGGGGTSDQYVRNNARASRTKPAVGRGVWGHAPPPPGKFCILDALRSILAAFLDTFSIVR